jgi:hypothetical protein
MYGLEQLPDGDSSTMDQVSGSWDATEVALVLAREYAVVLRKYLKKRPRASPQLMRVEGCRAVAPCLETLDSTGIHERALASPEASSILGATHTQ